MNGLTLDVKITLAMTGCPVTLDYRQLVILKNNYRDILCK